MDDEEIPRLARGVQPLRADDGSVVLRGWHRTLRVTGSDAELAWTVLDLIDGARSVADIAEAAGTEPARVRAALGRLARADAVELGAGVADAAPSEAAEFLAAAGAIGSDALAAALGDRRALLVGEGALAASLRDLLARSGVGEVVGVPVDGVLADELAAADAVVYAESDASIQRAWEIHDLAAARPTPWCAVWWEGSRIIVSHEMRFGRSACFECLMAHERGNAGQPEVHDALEALLRAGSVGTAGTAASPGIVETIAAGLAAVRCLSILLDDAWSVRPDQQMELRLRSLTLVFSTVLRLPSCQSCSPGLLRPPTPTFPLLAGE